MKKLTTGIVLLSLPFSTLAKSNFVTEALVGQASHDISATTSSLQRSNKFTSKENDTSLAFRFGYQFTDNYTVELAYHDHGQVTNKFELRIPTPAPPSSGGGCCLGPEHDTIVNGIIPTDVDSIRLGVKGQWQLFDSFSVNARLGVAQWQFGKYSPTNIGNPGAVRKSNEDGYDMYYAIGAEYQFTPDFYLGVEYSVLKIQDSYTYSEESSGSYQYDVNDFSLVLGWKF